MRYPNIEIVPIGDVVPYSTNPRSRNRKQVRALAKSLRTNGFNSPIIVDEDTAIIAGHGRYEAALELGLDTVPIVRITWLSATQKRAYRIADNKLGEGSQWHLENLSFEFEALIEAGADAQEETFFSTAEIDVVLGDAQAARGPDVAPEDCLPHNPGDRRVVSRLGDIWLLGPRPFPRVSLAVSKKLAHAEASWPRGASPALRPGSPPDMDQRADHAACRR